MLITLLGRKKVISIVVLAKLPNLHNNLIVNFRLFLIILCIGKKQIFVIKELQTDLLPREQALQAMEEVSILGSLNSPHIVSYIDSFVSDTKVNIIMEFCEYGDL